MYETYYENAAEKLKSLAHPKRLEILAYLVCTQECNVTALQSITKLPQPTLSQHLARMQRSGVLVRKKRGTEVYYNIASQDVINAISLLCGEDFAKFGQEQLAQAEKLES